MIPLASPVSVREKLLPWYDVHHRVLPWRTNPEPWAVWVSEIMLQQTRVDSVIGYFQRFMERFPTPAALAETDLDELMGYWAGLGYYARARNLHAAAVDVVEHHGGQVPDDPEAFAALKGVGRYTCGAVQSIAFGHRLPVLDGNVIRVISRLDLVKEDPRLSAVNRSLWARAEELLDERRPGDFNQAMMELGATVCTPKSPTCLLCPLSDICRIRHAGNPESLPVLPKRKKRPRKEKVAALAYDDAGLIWLRRRPMNGLLGGLWALPMLDGSDPKTLEGLALTPGDELATIEHAFTHQVWSVKVFSATGVPEDEDGEWGAFSLADIAQMGLGGPSLKALRASDVELPHRRGAGKAR